MVYSYCCTGFSVQTLYSGGKNMKKELSKIISVLLCLTLVFSVCSAAAGASEPAKQEPEVVSVSPNVINSEEINNLANEAVRAVAGVFMGMAPLNSWDDLLNNTLKVLYNVLNIITEVLVKTICFIYPDPADWMDVNDRDTSTFLEGTGAYRTEAADGNHWSLGYASRSLVPEDIDCGEYYIGRELNVIKAENGCYDDMRIRVSAISDNSGNGYEIYGCIDCLGVTSTDVRSIRKGVLEYCKEKNIDVSGIDIAATHCHSALDTQGVSTEFFYKLAANLLNNALRIFDELPGLEYATKFKNYFVEQSVIACEEALENVKDGEMYFGTIDVSDYVYDKRELVAREDIPEMATIKFVPDNGDESTYLVNITCHPTSFSASNHYVNSDYIYYVDQYIKEHDGGNLLLVQGALGQVSRDIDYDDSYLAPEDRMSGAARALGARVGESILATDFSLKLAPVLNTCHKEIILVPGNSILTLACECRLVNNQGYYTEDGVGIVSEIGYMEFGNAVGFAMFPGELYPEVFWGTDIIGNVSWDGTEWPYDSLHDSVDGVAVYPISLMNDATGYVVTDNYFAFMGHIIGEEISDEVLSVGKHEASFLVSNYLDLVNDYTK